MRICGNQKGSILLLTVLTIPLLFFFSAIAVDIGALYLQRSHMQNAADAAALAGASQLGVGKEAAKSMAIDYVVRNGYDSSEVNIDPDKVNPITSAPQIGVTITKNAPVWFMQYFSLIPTAISAYAVAEAAGNNATPDSDYVLVYQGTDRLTLENSKILNGSVYTQGALTIKQAFVNGSVYANGDLIISGSSVVNGTVRANGNVTIEGGATVNGSVYANGNLVLSNGTITGNASATGNVSASGSPKVNGSVTAGGSANIPEYLLNNGNIDPSRLSTNQTVPFSLVKPEPVVIGYENRIAAVKAQAVTITPPGGRLTIDSQLLVDTYLKGPLYVDGDVRVTFPNLVITAAIIAKGDITINTNANITGVGGVALVSENGNVSVTNWSTVKGLIAAPKGTVTTNGPLYEGGILAPQVDLGSASTEFNAEVGGGGGSSSGGSGGAGSKLRLVE